MGRSCIMETVTPGASGSDEGRPPDLQQRCLRGTRREGDYFALQWTSPGMSVLFTFAPPGEGILVGLDRCCEGRIGDVIAGQSTAPRSGGPA